MNVTPEDYLFIASLLQNPQVCAIFTTAELKAQAAQIQAKTTALAQQVQEAQEETDA